MKKILVYMFVILLLVSFAVSTTVLAADNKYCIDELDIRLTIPSEYLTITRDTPANDPIFNSIGTTKSTLISQFETSNIYLNAISDMHNEEIVVTMMVNYSSNFSDLNNATLNIIASELVNQYVDYGINVSKYDIYECSQVKYIRAYFTDDTNTVFGLQYYTIVDDKAMNFTIRSYEGSLFPRQEAAIKAIVDSIEYNTAAYTPVSGEANSSFIYTDTESGVTFTVPENWNQEATENAQESFDAKFVHTSENSCIIAYGSTDIWKEISASNKVDTSRADINNSIFTKADIAKMCNTTEEKVSVVTYNGIQYYKGETICSSNEYGIDLSFTITQLFYIDNGWMYAFQFSESSSHKLYSDYEKILNSVDYPTASKIPFWGDCQNTILEYDNPIYYIVMAVVLLFAIAAVIIISILISRKKNVIISNENRSVEITTTNEKHNDIKPTVTCKNCGLELPLDSSFCHACGTKTYKEEEQL